MPRFKPCPDSVLDALKTALGDKVVSVEVVNGQTRITLKREAVREALTLLKSHPTCPFEMLSDVAGADLSKLPSYTSSEQRFLVWFTLFSLSQHIHLVLRVLVPESDPTLPSSWPIYKTGIWTERETHEMFGLTFTGHPNLKRLLTPDYFDAKQQYPLRKDYPVQGLGDRENFPVYDPREEIDLTAFGYKEISAP